MKFLIVFVALFAVTLAAPVAEKAQILRSESEVNPDGFKYAFETSNGISAQEMGQIVNAGTTNEAISVTGSFSYIGDDGQTYTVTYVADENGFQPQGAHLPVAPQA